MEIDEESDQKSDVYPYWMAAHACLKNGLTEDEKCHNLMRWPIFLNSLEDGSRFSLNSKVGAQKYFHE